jgi:Domain of unknown function (DUF3291)
VSQASSGFHLAEFNIARLTHPLDSAEATEFVAALEPVNAIAEATPGFVWRLTDVSGASASYVAVPGIDDPQVIVNYSIWTNVESLQHFVYRSGHSAYLRRRREWFDASALPAIVCWWIPAGAIPPVDEAYERLLHMREHGPSERGWPPSQPFPAPN